MTHRSDRPRHKSAGQQFLVQKSHAEGRHGFVLCRSSPILGLDDIAMKTLSPLFALALGVSLLGCGGGSDADLLDLSGNVTFDGKPLPHGHITFTPDSSKKHTGPQGYAVIENGTFDTSAAGKGVVPGPHLVYITGFEQKPADGADENSPEVLNAPPPLFLDFKLEQELSSPTQDFAVPATAKGFGSQKQTAPRRNPNDA